MNNDNLNPRSRKPEWQTVVRIAPYPSIGGPNLYGCLIVDRGRNQARFPADFG